MAVKTPSPEEAVERAQRAHEDRIQSVRTLAIMRARLNDSASAAAALIAEAQQKAADLTSSAEIADVQAYDAAIRAGWTDAELKKIGFDQPEKKKRVARRRRPETPASAPATSGDDSGGSDAA